MVLVLVLVLVGVGVGVRIDKHFVVYQVINERCTRYSPVAQFGAAALSGVGASSTPRGGETAAEAG